MFNYFIYICLHFYIKFGFADIIFYLFIYVYCFIFSEANLKNMKINTRMSSKYKSQK